MTAPNSPEQDLPSLPAAITHERSPSSELTADDLSQSSSQDAVSEISAGTVPVVSLDVRGPQTLNEGQTGRYRLTIANVAEDSAAVIVEIGLPSHARLVRTNIESTQSDSTARFDLGTMAAEETREILFDVTAQSAGPMTLTSRVLVSSEVSLQVAVSQAKLETTVNGPRQVLAGSIVPLTITVTNGGSNGIDAIQVYPEAPQGVRVQADFETAGQVGWLAPGESREVVLHLIADQAGSIPIRLVAEANGLSSAVEHELEVQRPELEVEVEGPEAGVLQGTGEFAIVVANPTDVPVENVNVNVAIPAGLKLTTLDRQARFDATTGRLSFTLPSLAPGSIDGLRFKAQLLTEGSHSIAASASIGDGLPSGGELLINVSGQADVTVQIEDEGRPLAVGTSTRLNLTVKNQGTRAAQGIVVRVELPTQLSSESSAEGESDGNTIFLPEFSLAPGEEKVVPLSVLGVAAGTSRIKAIVMIDGVDEELIDTDQVIVY